MRHTRVFAISFALATSLAISHAGLSHAGVLRVATTAPAPASGVTIIGDSLVAGREAVYEAPFRDAGRAVKAYGRGSRALRWGWQCRSRQGRLEVYSEPTSTACAMEGLELLRSLATSDTLEQNVVLALGTNDSGLFTPTQATASLDEARKLVGARHIYLVSIVKPGSKKAPSYTKTVKSWCEKDAGCTFIDWAQAPESRGRGLYSSDRIHLTEKGAKARAAFIASAVLAANP